MAKARLCLLSPQINAVILLRRTEIHPKGGERDQILLIRRAPSASAPQSLPRLSSAQSLEKIHGKGKADGEKGGEEAPAAAGFVQRCGVSQRKGDGQQKHRQVQSKGKCTTNCVAENAEETTAAPLPHLAEHGAGGSGSRSSAPSPDLPCPLFFESSMCLPTRCVVAKYFHCIHIQIYVCVCVYTISLLFCNIKDLVFPYCY